MYIHGAVWVSIQPFPAGGEGGLYSPLDFDSPCQLTCYMSLFDRYTQHEQGFCCASFCYSSLEFLEFSEFYSSTCFGKLPNLLVSVSITKHPVCQFSGDQRGASTSSRLSRAVLPVSCAWATTPTMASRRHRW